MAIIIITVVESRFGFFPRFSSCSPGSEVIISPKFHRDLVLQEVPTKIGFDSFPRKLRKQKRSGGEPLSPGQGNDRQDGKKVENLHYICQEWKVRKAIIMNEHAIQHTNSPAKMCSVIPQQDLSTPGTQGRQGAISPCAELDVNTHAPEPSLVVLLPDHLFFHKFSLLNSCAHQVRLQLRLCKYGKIYS